MQGIAVDVEQLNLEFRAVRIFDNMLIGPNNADNTKNFKLQYGQTPLEISGFRVIRLEDGEIQHGIEIEAAFPYQPNGLMEK